MIPMPEDAKQKITALFQQVANRYDNPAMRYFPFCGDRMITHLRPRPGEKILDIATGTGAVALPAAQAVAPHGRVQAIDLAENMLNIAANNLQRAGLNNVDFHLMDAESLDFKSRYFDAVTCSFGIFFLSDMQAALKEWKRVLKPGGKVIFTTFSANAFAPLAEQFRADLELFDVTFPEETWLRLTTETECLELLHSAGFENNQTTTEQLGYHLNSPADWWEIILSSGLRGFLNALDNEQQEQLQQRHLANIQSHVTDKGLWLDVETLFAIGQRPA